MEKFVKNINNELVIKSLKDIIIYKGDMQIINPKKSQVLADGWELYVAPTLTEEELVDIAKKSKINDLMTYDASEEINIFYIQQMPLWLDKLTRSGLILRFQAEKEIGIEKTTLWYNGLPFELAIDDAIKMLYSIERYASKCYDNTQKHLSNINNLTTVEKINKYNYQSGYPEKLQF